MTFDELVNLIAPSNARPAHGRPNVRTDSRIVEPGDIFVAIPGTICDGHHFIDQALANGAKYIVCQSRPSATQYAIRNLALSGVEGTQYETIVVDDSARAAGILAQAAEGSPAAKLTNLAVTGTNGKTTVAFLVRSVIRQAGPKCGLIGTVIYDTCSGKSHEAPMTTPDCLSVAKMMADMAANGAEYMVIEASSHALAQNRLAGLDFAAAAFTNLAGDHLDYHKTEQDYLAAKTRLFETLAPEGVAVLNRQATHAQLIAEQTKARILWYAIDAQADITAHVESMNAAGTIFTLRYSGQSYKVTSSLLGLYNVSNCLATAGLCLAAGFGLQTVARGLSSPQAIPGRLEQVDWPGDFTVLIDYAHTDDALKNVLATLKPLCKGKLIVVFGCGGDRDRTKRPRMARAAELYGDLVVVTSDNPRTEKPQDIIDEIVVGFQNADAIRAADSRETNCRRRVTKIVEPDRKKAIRLAIEAAEKDDIVLIAGKGHETYQIIGKQKHHFSDKEIAQQCLKGLA